MTIKTRQLVGFILTLLFSLITTTEAKSQSLLDKIKKKAGEAFTNKKRGNEAGNKTNAGETNSKNIPDIADQKESVYTQNYQNPSLDNNNTRINIAQNLAIDITGKYPTGYAPMWKYISYNSSLNFELENYLSSKAITSQKSKYLSIMDFGGKAVIRFDAFILCHCFADIMIKDGLKVLTEEPQTFELANFRKVSTDPSSTVPCMPANNSNYAGGWTGKITLSANKTGDISMDLVLENYTAEKKKRDGIIPSQVAVRYIAKEITIQNEMNTEKANNISKLIRQNFIRDSIKLVAEKLKEIEDEKNFEIKIKNSLSKIALIQKKYNTAYNCLKLSSGERLETYTRYEETWVSGSWSSAVGSNVDFEKKSIPVTDYVSVKFEGLKNNCNSKVVVLGIKKLKSQRGTIYYEDASIELAPEEMTESVITIEDRYNQNSAEIGSTHYFKNKLLQK